MSFDVDHLYTNFLSRVFFRESIDIQVQY